MKYFRAEKIQEFEMSIDTDKILKLCPDFFEAWSDAICPIDSWEDFAESLVLPYDSDDIPTGVEINAHEAFVIVTAK